MSEFRIIAEEIVRKCRETKPAFDQRETEKRLERSALELEQIIAEALDEARSDGVEQGYKLGHQDSAGQG